MTRSHDGVSVPRLFAVLAVAFVCMFSTPIPAVAAGEKPLLVRVGAYENPPKIFTDKSGRVSGFWPDLIRAIAVAENWRLEFVPGSWSEGLERLKNGTIDIMPDVAFTRARRQRYVFSENPVLLSWTQVYVQKDRDDIHSILDLKDRKIAALKESVNLNGPGGLREIAGNFHLQCEFLELNNYDEVFQAIENGKADAGITNRDYGDLNAGRFSVKKTPILFQPIDMRFAFTGNGRLTPYLVSRIDVHMKDLQRDGNSFYYRLLKKYFSGTVAERQVNVVPSWVWNVLRSIALVIVMLIAVVVTSRIQIRRKTRDLVLRNEEFAESRKFIESIVNLSPVILYIYDVIARKNVYSNNGIERMLGYSVEEIANMGDQILPTLMHPDDFSTYLKEIYPRYRELRGDETISHQYRMRHKDGEWHWLDGEERIYARRPDGSPHQILGIAHDITDKKQAKEVRDELRERLITLLENMGDAFVALDKDWHYTYVNRKAGELFGREPADLVGKHIWTEFPEGVGQPFYKAYHRAVREQREIRLEEFYPPWDRWYENRIFPTPDGLSIFFTDISERKTVEQKLGQAREKLEERVQERTSELENTQKSLLNLLEDVNEAKKELEKANARLSELDQLKSMFIASMSHELRTPLNSIIGFTGLLLQELPGTLNVEQKKQLSIVKKSSHHLLDLINDIIDISKIEAGKVSLDWGDCPIASLVKSVADTLRPEALAKGLRLEVVYSEDPVIQTDARRLSQVILNIVSNAVKFTASGSVTIRMLKHEKELEISVSDTGMGIEPEDLSRLFLPFSRIHKSGDPFVPGTGLGLYLSRKLMELMGGSISVESEIEKGSTFTILLSPPE